jgi:UDP-N-acetyl-2-amino-2-deoxyglucuronate dehydrogenase
MKQIRDCVNFALIGCGRISEKHVNAIKSTPGAKMVAVCDTKEDRAQAVALALNCDYYSDYKEMLKRPDIDVVDLCTPNGSHANLTLEIANSGKHVLCEKPMALKVEDCDRMIKACKDNDVHLFVIKQNRFNPPITKLREAIDRGRFGKLFLGNITVRWTRPQEYYDETDWHGTKNIDGGMLFTQASHHVDMLQWMMGPVHSVKANIATLNHKIETEDTAVVVLKFKNGAMGVIEATTCTFPKNMEGSITILGEKGTVKIGGMAMNKVDHWEFADFRNEDENIKDCATNPTNVYGFGHNEVIRHVVDSILCNGPIVSAVGGEEGRKSVKLIEAIYESAETGKEVFID